MTRSVLVRIVPVVCVCAGMMLHAQDAPKAPPASRKIEAVEIRGAKRVDPDALKALLTIKAGDTYDEKAVKHDFDKLWNTGRFDDIKVTHDEGEHGGVVVRFTVTERAN